jgi:hypothetical protein
MTKMQKQIDLYQAISFVSDIKNEDLQIIEDSQDLD